MSQAHLIEHPVYSSLHTANDMVGETWYEVSGEALATWLKSVRRRDEIKGDEPLPRTTPNQPTVARSSSARSYKVEGLHATNVIGGFLATAQTDSAPYCVALAKTDTRSSNQEET